MKVSSLVLILCASLFNQYGANTNKNDMYPWGASKFEDRQEDILESFRQNMVLELKREIIPKHLLDYISNNDTENSPTPTKLTMRNLEGFEFFVEPERKSLSTPAPTPTVVLNDGITNRRLLSKSMKGVCAFYNKEYWSFEWCHRKEVRQAHIEFVGGKVIRDPDWSLGSYQTSSVEREGGNHRNRSAPIIRMTDHFTGGQRCDETNEHRRTSVHFVCCTRSSDAAAPAVSIAGKPPRHGLSAAHGPSNTPSVIFIDHVEETQTCQYDVTVCVPKLCRTPSDTPSMASPSVSSAAADTASLSTDAAGVQDITSSSTDVPATREPVEEEDKTLVTVVKSLGKNCLYRQEEWWMYEICFNKGIRQMHARSESVQQSNGVLVHTQVIDDQYSLGDAPIAIYTNNTALMRAAGFGVRGNLQVSSSSSSSSSVAGDDDGSMPDSLQPKEGTASGTKGAAEESEKVAKWRVPMSGMPVTGFGRDGSPEVLTLEFENGTPCDIESLNRSTSVQIQCGARELIVDILEDRTCHYTIKVSTPLLCLHAAFAPAKQEVERFVITPLNPPPVTSDGEEVELKETRAEDYTSQRSEGEWHQESSEVPVAEHRADDSEDDNEEERTDEYDDDDNKESPNSVHNEL